MLEFLPAVFRFYGLPLLPGASLWLAIRQRRWRALRFFLLCMAVYVPLMLERKTHQT